MRLTEYCLLAAACLFCNAAKAEPVVHFYTVSVGAALERLQVEAQFGRPVSEVAARSRDADDFIEDARECENNVPIDHRGRRLRLSPTGISCLRYSVDLERAVQEHRYHGILSPDNVIASPSLWLWRPALRGDTSIRIEFRLPEDLTVSVPWQPLGANGRIFELSGSPESAYAPVVFGKLDYHELAVPGATLRVTLVRGRSRMDQDSLLRWIRATATDVSLAYGRFPNPSPQVVVIPVGNSRRNARSAVPFGRVIRDGGETVELLVDQSQPLDKLLGDWTATHEFSHLMLPYVDREHRWISEGFAQYYQNVLLSRSGAYEPRYAWQKIYDGYGRGQRSRPDMSPNEAAANRARSGLMKIYWSGAAIALLADVQLRERPGGAESLDNVLDRFQACCLPSDRVWDGRELFAKFDELAGLPVFTPLYHEHANTAGFPDTSGVFERLGLTVTDGRVEIEDDAELRAIRDAILKTDTETARWRQQLSAD